MAYSIKVKHDFPRQSLSRSKCSRIREERLQRLSRDTTQLLPPGEVVPSPSLISWPEWMENLLSVVHFNFPMGLVYFCVTCNKGLYQQQHFAAGADHYEHNQLRMYDNLLAVTVKSQDVEDLGVNVEGLQAFDSVADPGYTYIFLHNTVGYFVLSTAVTFPRQLYCAQCNTVLRYLRNRMETRFCCLDCKFHFTNSKERGHSPLSAPISSVAAPPNDSKDCPIRILRSLTTAELNIDIDESLPGTKFYEHSRSVDSAQAECGTKAEELEQSRRGLDLQVDCLDEERIVFVSPSDQNFIVKNSMGTPPSVPAAVIDSVRLPTRPEARSDYDCKERDSCIRGQYCYPALQSPDGSGTNDFEHFYTADSTSSESATNGQSELKQTQVRLDINVGFDGELLIVLWSPSKDQGLIVANSMCTPSNSSATFTDSEDLLTRSAPIWDLDSNLEEKSDTGCKRNYSAVRGQFCYKALESHDGTGTKAYDHSHSIDNYASEHERSTNAQEFEQSHFDIVVGRDEERLFFLSRSEQSSTVAKSTTPPPFASARITTDSDELLTRQPPCSDSDFKAGEKSKASKCKPIKPLQVTVPEKLSLPAYFQLQQQATAAGCCSPLCQSNSAPQTRLGAALIMIAAAASEVDDQVVSLSPWQSSDSGLKRAALLFAEYIRDQGLNSSGEEEISRHTDIIGGFSCESSVETVAARTNAEKFADNDDPYKDTIDSFERSSVAITAAALVELQSPVIDIRYSADLKSFKETASSRNEEFADRDDYGANDPEISFSSSSTEGAKLHNNKEARCSDVKSFKIQAAARFRSLQQLVLET